jgi:hypothetical protein
MSPQPFPAYVDGYYSPERELTLLPDVQFPFENYPTPDIYARLLTHRYNMVPSLYKAKMGNTTVWKNSFTYSEQIGNGAWTKTNSTVNVNQVGNPEDGGITVCALMESGATGVHSLSQAYTATAAPTTMSAFAGVGLGRDWILLQFTDSGATVFSAYFNIASGAVGATSAGVVASSLAVGFGLYRLIITFTPASGGGTGLIAVATGSGSSNYTGNTSNGVYLWGIEIKAASSAGPYISTTSGAVQISAPDVDPTDPFAFLSNEAAPKNMTSAVGTVERIFARVPVNQIQTISKSITRPTPRNTYVASTSQTGQLATPFRVDQVSGSLNFYTADDGCLIGGCLVTAQLRMLFNLVKAITAATPSGAGYNYTIPSHGYNGSLQLAIFNPLAAPATFFIFQPADWSIIDANTIYAQAGGGAAYAGTYLKAFSPGTIIVRARQTESFYLPGVTAGISSPTDISLPTQIANDIDYFNAISGNASNVYIPYDFQGPEKWNGRIYKLTEFDVLAGDL